MKLIRKNLMVFLHQGIFIGTVIFSLNIQSQKNDSENESIKNTIQKYIDGTTLSEPSTFEDAFIPQAKLFLDHKDKPLFEMSVSDYSNHLAKGQKGVSNGRITNILSITSFQGIATAKLEVIIPDSEMRFIDMLLLKKLPEGWRIISKTAASENAITRQKKVLLVLSNVEKQGDSELHAGNSFSEVVIAYDGYQKAGYHVDIVSPKGGKVPLAYIDPSDELQLKYLYDSDFMYALKHSLNPNDVKPSEYSIVQFTGGSSPIFDVPENLEIQNIVMEIYEENNGVIAAVCHGTSGIVNLRTKDGKYLVEGKVVNGVPDAHESKGLPHYKNYPFIIETVLRERGGIFKNSPIRTPHMEVDGRLVTGQNSLSSEMVTKKSIELDQSEKGGL